MSNIVGGTVSCLQHREALNVVGEESSFGNSALLSTHIASILPANEPSVTEPDSTSPACSSISSN